MPAPLTDKSSNCQLGGKPDNERDYFEQMSKVIFRSGLNRKMIDSKWPAFRQAFADYSIRQVADYGEEDLDRLLKNEKIVRNYRKLKATVDNARTLLAVQEEFGSFEKYLNEIRPTGEEAMSRTLSKRFSYLGGSTVLFFLRAIGEEMPESVQRWSRKK